MGILSNGTNSANNGTTNKRRSHLQSEDPNETSVRFRGVESSRVESSVMDDDTAANRSHELGMASEAEYSRHGGGGDHSKSLEFTTASSDHFTNSQTKRSSSYSTTANKWRRESQWVQWSKYFVMLFLAVTCAGCATGMYFLTKASETANFQDEFDDFASELIAISYQNANHALEAIANFGTTLTSYALDSPQDFPLVTLPHFEQRGFALRQITGASFVGWNVLVDESNVNAWNNYTVQQEGWVQEGLNAQAQREGTQSLQAQSISPVIYRFDDRGSGNLPSVRIEDTMNDTKLVTWQVSPVPQDPTMVNQNLFSTEFGSSQSKIGVQRFSKFIDDRRYQQLDESSNQLRPQSYLAQPIYRDFQADDDSSIVGYLLALLPWDCFFQNIIPDGFRPLVVVLSNDCGDLATLQVEGPQVTVLSYQQDTHDPQFDDLVVTHKWQTMEDATDTTIAVDSSSSYWCNFEISIYPTEEFQADSEDDESIFYPLGIVGIFVFTAAVFLLHDQFIARRQARIEETAARSNAIVQSLFPAQVRERLLMGQEEKASEHITRNEEKQASSGRGGDALVGANMNNKKQDALNPADGGDPLEKLLLTKPIADLFPNATVMFADICGFTAWSSVREPTQVFTLLEQIYNSFDILARKRRVFKVETIGDCYVAAAGLPDPRPDHAVAMARFANECLIKMHSVVKKLEVRLGPDTAELGMRFGLHSGPVTAGVLRGEKSRFQLFGDTVNTASRIETTGERNRVHLSEDTARILIQSGKESWVERRDGVVAAKGKGDMVTYWLTLAQSKLKRKKKKRTEKKTESSEGESSVSPKREKKFDPLGDSEHPNLDIPERSISLDQQITYDDRKQRLIDWNVDVLTSLLKKITAMRSAEDSDSVSEANFEHDSWRYAHAETTVLDEVQEIIKLPQEEQVYKRDPQNCELGEKALEQLKEYVGLIASMYHENSFHNFEHASHVTQSVTKLLSRIVTADDIDYNAYQYKKKTDIADLHQHTYGITSDPITQFACAFSALIHDVDHTGVPNAQLIKEESDVALFYKNKSVAEQNSVDLAWSLLMEPDFDALRSCIYRDKDELDRFRQLVVNSVMATDIADRELGAARKARWVKAFAHLDDESVDTMAMRESRIDAVNRKATIVIEHLIQASDVSHTMQHWHVYSKWNEKLFHEMYGAFKSGRAAKDPAEFWYTGELGFFDFYIIPLAKKLKECGVFGVASDEYLNYAEANREEWERKGLDMVAKYLDEYEEKKE